MHDFADVMLPILRVQGGMGEGKYGNNEVSVTFFVSAPKCQDMVLEALRTWSVVSGGGGTYVNAHARVIERMFLCRNTCNNCSLLLPWKCTTLRGEPE